MLKYILTNFVHILWCPKMRARVEKVDMLSWNQSLDTVFVLFSYVSNMTLFCLIERAKIIKYVHLALQFDLLEILVKFLSRWINKVSQQLLTRRYLSFTVNFFSYFSSPLSIRNSTIKFCRYLFWRSRELIHKVSSCDLVTWPRRLGKTAVENLAQWGRIQKHYQNI